MRNPAKELIDACRSQVEIANAEVETAFLTVLEELQKDFVECDYEPSSRIEAALDQLHLAVIHAAAELPESAYEEEDGNGNDNLLLEEVDVEEGDVEEHAKRDRQPHRQRSIATVAGEIRAAVLDASPEEQSAVRGLTELVAVDNKQLAREIIALKRAAALFAVTKELADSPRQAVQLIQAVDAEIGRAVGQIVSVLKLDERRKEYLPAITVFEDDNALFRANPGAEMLAYPEEPTENVGKLFAFVCRTDRDPLVAGMGSVLFASTAGVVRDILNH